MGDSLLYKLRSGKPPKIFFFLKGYLLMCMPTCFFRLCRKRYLAQVETRSDKDYIYERVNYYNKMRHPLPYRIKPFTNISLGIISFWIRYVNFVLPLFIRSTTSICRMCFVGSVRNFV